MGARSPSTGEDCDLVACGAPRPGVARTGSPGDSLDVGLQLTHRDGGPSSGGPRSGFVLRWEAPQLCLCVERRIVRMDGSGPLGAHRPQWRPVGLLCFALWRRALLQNRLLWARGWGMPGAHWDVLCSQVGQVCSRGREVVCGPGCLSAPSVPLLDRTASQLCPFRGCSRTPMGQVGKRGAEKSWCGLLRTSPPSRPWRAAAE